MAHIVHIDLNDFLVSVERKHDPSLNGRAVVDWRSADGVGTCRGGVAGGGAARCEAGHEPVGRRLALPVRHLPRRRVRSLPRRLGGHRRTAARAAAAGRVDVDRFRVHRRIGRWERVRERACVRRLGLGRGQRVAGECASGGGTAADGPARAARVRSGRWHRVDEDCRADCVAARASGGTALRVARLRRASARAARRGVAARSAAGHGPEAAPRRA